MENIAIQIEDFDEGRRLEDVELGLAQPNGHHFAVPSAGGGSSESLERLIPAGLEDREEQQPQKEERLPPSPASPKALSVNSPSGQRPLSSRLPAFLLSRVSSLLSSTKIFWLVVLYTIFGAHLFIWLEVQTDLATRREAHDYHLVARDSFLFKVQQVHQGRELEPDQHWKRAILEFEQVAGCGPPQLDSQWTFWQAVLYCATIYTTVGYGNIACVTTGGRVATILYAICGIPLMIVVLDSLGTFLLRQMKQLSCLTDDIMFFLGVRYHLVRLNDQEAFLRYISVCRTLARLRLIPSTITLTVTEEEERPANSSREHSENNSSPTESPPSTGSMEEMCKRSKRGHGRSNRQAERRSLKMAQGKGSLLDNLEPFQIESIVAPGSELAQRLLLLPHPLPSSRRSSKTSTATIHLRLDEADKLLSDKLAAQSPRESSRRSSANGSVHSQSVVSQPQEAASPESPKTLGHVRHSPPLLIALLVTTGWIALAAGVFCLWEEWTYFTSVYFFFISMSTIGFGDITPAYPQYMIMSFLVVVVGLSLVSVCINVVQEKCSQMYMDFLNKMLQQYMKARDSGDMEALKVSMEGFNQRCKYLMPFISKNQGIRIMNQFKEEAKAMGVDLPEVMTELSQETGKPAFCKIFDEKCDERVNEFLERAQQQGKMRRNAHTQTRMPPLPKTHKFFISKAEAGKEEFEAQTDLANAAGGRQLDTGTQTPGASWTDSGIQCSPTVSDGWTMAEEGGRGAKQTENRGTSTKAVWTKSRGQQPEVSCIMGVLADEEGEEWEEEEEEEEDKSGSGRSSSASAELSSQLVAGRSSKEVEMGLEGMPAVSWRRSRQMQRTSEFEMEEAGEIEGNRQTAEKGIGLKRGTSPTRGTIQMEAKRASGEEEEEDRSGGKESPRKGRRRKMRAGLRYLRNAATQMEQKREEKETQTEEEKEEKRREFADKEIQWEKSDECGPYRAGSWPAGDEMDEEELISFETADDWRNSIGAQTERELRRTRRVQTERAVLVSRPAQTQLSSTFRREEGRMDERGEAEEGIAEIALEGGEPQEAGGLERQRQRLRREFQLEDKEIEMLRERVRQMRRAGRLQKREMDRMASSSGSSGAEELMLSKEDKLALAAEIGRLREERRENAKEEEEEEEEIEEGVQSGRRRRAIAGKGIGATGELLARSEQFTLQVSKPAQKGHIVRENYEQTILDVQLIKSPFFETKYLPQAQEQLIFAEAELTARERKSQWHETDKQKKSRRALETEGEIDLNKLLRRLGRMDTLSQAVEEEGRGEKGAGSFRRWTVEEQAEEIGQFTRESWVQTAAEEEERDRALEEAMGLVRMVERKPGITIEELKRWAGSRVDGDHWDRETQTREEEGEGQTEVEEQEQGREQRKGSGLLERVVGIWKGARERGGTSRGTAKREKAGKGTTQGRQQQQQQHQGTKRDIAEGTSGEGTSGEGTSLVTLPRQPLGSKESGRRKGEKHAGKEDGGDGDEKQKEEKVQGGGDGGRLLLGPRVRPISNMTDQTALDPREIVLIQTSEGVLEPMKMRRPEGKGIRGEGQSAGGSECELVPLSEAELEQFAQTFAPSGHLQGGRRQTPGELSREGEKGLHQFVWQSSIDPSALAGKLSAASRGMKVVRTEEGKILLADAGLSGKGGQSAVAAEREQLRIVPLDVFLASGSRQSTEAATSGIRPWPSEPGRDLHQTQADFLRSRGIWKSVERIYFPYDIPLRDISEFVQQKRHELGELERQRRQMERMGQLAAREGEEADRMVDVSVQTGVQSRVVRALGEKHATGDPEKPEEIDYLNNPVFSIARVPLLPSSDEEARGDSEDSLENGGKGDDRSEERR